MNNGGVMQYVIADIHGCYEEYRELIHKIKVSEEKDHLYILGDALDRGPEPMKVLLDIMKRRNVTYIIGNHDYLFLYFIRKLGLDLSNANNMSEDDISDFQAYLEDGGLTTIEAFMKLSYEEKQAVCDFLLNANVYDEVRIGDKRYILVHAGIGNFMEGVSLDEYNFLDFICERTDYKKRYYQDRNTYVITGHTPTMYINADSSPQVYIGNGHIAIDCGCIYGGKLAAYCIEKGSVTYVDAKKEGCNL